MLCYLVWDLIARIKNSKLSFYPEASYAVTCEMDRLFRVLSVLRMMQQHLDKNLIAFIFID
jgi:hypothetical protein